MLFRVRHRCRTANEDRFLAVKTANPDKASDNVCKMGAEHPPVDMKFVDHYISEICKKLLPFRMVREYSRMEHVRIRDHDMSLLADGLAGIVGRVAVVCICLYVRPQVGDQTVHLVHLVLGEGLGRKDIDGTCFRLFNDFVQDGNIITEGLPARCRGDDHHITAFSNQIHRLGLVAVKLIYPSCLEDGLNARVNPIGEGGEFPLKSGQPFHRPDVFHEAPVVFLPG